MDDGRIAEKLDQLMEKIDRLSDRLTRVELALETRGKEDKAYDARLVCVEQHLQVLERDKERAEGAAAARREAGQKTVEERMAVVEGMLVDTRTKVIAVDALKLRVDALDDVRKEAQGASKFAKWLYVAIPATAALLGWLAKHLSLKIGQ